LMCMRAAKAKTRKASEPRVAAAYCVPQSVSPEMARQGFAQFALAAQKDGIFRDVDYFGESSCVGLDGATSLTDQQILRYGDEYIQNRLHASEVHPDACGPILIRDPNDTEKVLSALAGDKYSYHELDEFTDLIARTLVGTPQASKYQRAGVVPEAIFLD